ncbi:MAG: hypothetical protein IH986_05940 [Planctomycetes bacterium]|nr:hypothetical protein [Planctomycetota bacterium]
MSLEPFKTAQGSDYTGCRQLLIFLENQVGQLLRLTRVLDAEDVHILGITVEGSIDYAIVRMIVDDPDAARRMISEAPFVVTEADVLVVELPPGHRAILAVCAALISGEVSINYSYPMLASPRHEAALAIQVDNLSQAVAVLHSKRFQILDQSDL